MDVVLDTGAAPEELELLEEVPATVPPLELLEEVPAVVPPPELLDEAPAVVPPELLTAPELLELALAVPLLVVGRTLMLKPGSVAVDVPSLAPMTMFGYSPASDALGVPVS